MSDVLENERRERAAQAAAPDPKAVKATANGQSQETPPPLRMA